MEPINYRVVEIIADVFNLESSQVQMDASPDTIEEWDSIQHLNIVLALEQEFHLQFSPEEISEMLNVELIVMLIAEKLSKN